MKYFLLITTLFFTAYSAKGQLDNHTFLQHRSILPQDSSTLWLGVNTLAFTKNNEYFNKIADGYTLFGYQLNPYLRYQPFPDFTIEAGAYIQKDFGNEDYSQIAPTFRLKYATGNSTLIFGTLEGDLSHQLIEPLYDFERALINRLENGLQYKLATPRLGLDTWFSWQNMLYKGENDQEEVNYGLSMQYDFYKKEKLTLSFPFQLVVIHRGGQIDSSPAPLLTHANFATGIQLTKPMGDGFVRSFQMNHYYLYYQAIDGEAISPYKNGSAVYLNASIKTKAHLTIMGSYWRGHEFISVMGGQLYPSISATFKHPNYTEGVRELFILRFMHDLKLHDGLTLSGRFEPHYDITNKKIEFSHGLYINYQPQFKLK